MNAYVSEDSDVELKAKRLISHPGTIFRSYPGGMDFVFHRAGGVNRGTPVK